MDRSFVIVHISDLHLDGAGRYRTTIEALHSTIEEKLHEFREVEDRILLITGDLVDNPTDQAFDEAARMLASFKQGSVFTDVQALAGNHDVKPLGLLRRRRKRNVYDVLGLPRKSKSLYYQRSGLDLVLLDSNAASFAKGRVDRAAYDSMVASAADLASSLKKQIASRPSKEYLEPQNSIVRVLALHHHPLPQATGEGKHVLGVPDEPLMYLVSPATFLEAALSLNVSLILHGHRHVQGLTRYSIPSEKATSSEIPNEFWTTVYVLSCPSSTGHGGDDPGFNIIHFVPRHAARRLQYEFVITRYVRRNNAGAFVPFDKNLLRGLIHLPTGADYYRDPAFQVLIELRALDEIDRKQFVTFARRLLTRRAFYNEIEQSWSHALYTYLVTYGVWEDLLTKLTNSKGLERDIETGRNIRMRLDQLVSETAATLGINGAELDDLRFKPLIDQHSFMDRLPRYPRDPEHAARMENRRLSIIAEINDEMSGLGVQLGLGKRVPPGEVPE